MTNAIIIGNNFVNTGLDHLNYVLGLNDVIGVVVGGQSNAFGTNADNASTSPVDLRSPLDDVWMRISGSTFSKLDWGSNDKGQNVGSILSLGYYLKQKYRRPIYCDVIAESGAPVAAEVGRNDFNVSSGELYPLLSASLLAVQAKIVSLGKNPIMILVWIQGERDTLNSSMANSWYQNFTDIINQLATDGVTLKGLVINTLNSNLDVDPTLRAAVQTQQLQFINANNKAYRLDMNAYTLGADLVHYSGPTQEQIGIDIVNNIIGTQIITSATQYGFSDVLAKMNSVPPATYQTAMQNFVNGCISDGTWNEIYEIQCRALDTEANSLRGWKGNYNATNHGATHTPKLGFDYNGTSNYVDTGLNSSIASTLYYLKDDAGIGCYVTDNQAVNVRALFGVNDPNTNYKIQFYQNTNINYLLHQVSIKTYTGETSFADASMYSILRTGSAAIALYKNGTSVNTGTTASTAEPGLNLYEGAINANGTANTFFDGIIGLHITFKATTMNMSSLYSRVQALMTALAAI